MHRGAIFTQLFIATAGFIALIAMLPNLTNTMKNTVDNLRGDSPPSPAPPAPPPPTTSAPATDWDWSATIGIGAGVLVSAAVLGVLIALTWRIGTKHRAQRRADRASRALQMELWQQGVKALADTSTALWDFENDPESVYFTRRLLSDVDEPATAAFYTAYDTAQNMHTDTVPHDTTRIQAFVDAAATARRTFGIADENARRKARLGISHAGHRLTTEQNRKITQARKLMHQAHDPATTEAHAHNALTKALSLLDDAGVIVPERLTTNVTKSIDTIHRRALTGTPSTPAAAAGRGIG